MEGQICNNALMVVNVIFLFNLHVMIYLKNLSVSTVQHLDKSNSVNPTIQH